MADTPDGEGQKSHSADSRSPDRSASGSPEENPREPASAGSGPETGTARGQPSSADIGQGKPNLPPGVELPPKLDEVVAKTKLELDDCRDVAPQVERVNRANASSQAKEEQTVSQSVMADFGRGQPNVPSGVELPPKLDEVVARTNLDLDACRDVISRTQADIEVKQQELKESQGDLEPVKPFQPIDDYKQASPCSARWESMEGTERVRYCKQCRLQIYDFTGMELPEAQELVFRREAKKDAVLYKRADGKFLTSDCPVAAQRKMTILVATAVGVVLVVAVLALLMLSPPPPKPTQAESTPAVKPAEAETSPSAQAPANFPQESIGRRPSDLLPSPEMPSPPTATPSVTTPETGAPAAAPQVPGQTQGQANVSVQPSQSGAQNPGQSGYIPSGQAQGGTLIQTQQASGAAQNQPAGAAPGQPASLKSVTHSQTEQSPAAQGASSTDASRPAQTAQPSQSPYIWQRPPVSFGGK